MGGGVTMSCLLSLAEHIFRMIPHDGYLFAVTHISRKTQLKAQANYLKKKKTCRWIRFIKNTYHCKIWVPLFNHIWQSDWKCGLVKDKSSDMINGKWYEYSILSIMLQFMMTLSNGNIFHVTGYLSRWIPHTKASDAELWCFLWSEPQ